MISSSSTIETGGEQASSSSKKAGSKQLRAQPSSSSTKKVEAASASCGSGDHLLLPEEHSEGKAQQAQVRVLAHRDDGSIIEARYYQKSSAILAEVWSVPKPGGTTTTPKRLGGIRLMVDRNKGTQTLQAFCKCHNRCMCWISSTQHCDLLLQWLVEADQQTAEKHRSLCVELKKGIGMKTRS